MVARNSALALARSSAVLAKVTAPAPVTSSGKFPGRHFDMHRLRTVFPTRWASFLRQHFRSSAEVAVFFGCDDRTARSWREGTNAPAAAFALVAVAAIPGALDALMEGDQ